MDVAGHYLPGLFLPTEKGDSESGGDALIFRTDMPIADKMDQQNPARTCVRCGWQYLMILNLRTVDPRTGEVISASENNVGGAGVCHLHVNR